MKKKIKWIVLAVVILLIVFAPLPIPHFTSFDSAFNVDGQEKDVTIKARFVHFKPLFFHYDGFAFGAVKLYDNATEEEVCDLKFNPKAVYSYSEDTYMGMLFEPTRQIFDESGDEVIAIITYHGDFIWDKSFDNVILKVAGEGQDYEEMAAVSNAADSTNSAKPEENEPAQVRVTDTYFASKRNLNVDEFVDLFYDYKGIFMSNLESELSYKEKPTIYHLTASFTIDYHDLNAVVGDADYVFVGEVISEDGTEYRDYVTVETESGGFKEIGDPYTKYTVSVTENIKGNLMTEEAIPIVKYGGVSEDGRACYLFEDDELPTAGGIYIFFAYAQDDGSLLVSGPVSNVLVKDGDSAAKMSNGAITYEDVVNAYQNQIDSGRKRSVSIYEKK